MPITKEEVDAWLKAAKNKEFSLPASRTDDILDELHRWKLTVKAIEDWIKDCELEGRSYDFKAELLFTFLDTITRLEDNPCHEIEHGISLQKMRQVWFIIRGDEDELEALSIDGWVREGHPSAKSFETEEEARKFYERFRRLNMA